MSKNMRKLKLDELGRKSIDQTRKTKKIPVHIVLDNFRSGGNVGAFFRTSDAFGFEKIHLCGITPIPPHPQIHKTAIGSIETVAFQQWSSSLECVANLKSIGFQIIGIEQTTSSIHLHDFSFPLEKFALVFGNEVEGLSNNILEHLDSAVDIEQFGSKHSLNVAVCGGIVMYEVLQKFLQCNK